MKDFVDAVKEFMWQISIFDIVLSGYHGINVAII